MTTRDPGASDVLMCLGTFKPASTAFLANRPAASSTFGFDVLVQDVMAAIRMSPFLILVPVLVVKVWASFSAGWLKPFSATGLENRSMNVFLTLPISMRSCGRFGPASDGATVDRSSVSSLVKLMSWAAGMPNIFCALK
ncbi:Uncharacterised protein [Achromobacter denitrificans]|nr:Uncharacterised protein [Achromobacter denitrificans]